MGKLKTWTNPYYSSSQSLWISSCLKAALPLKGYQGQVLMILCIIKSLLKTIKPQHLK